MTTLQQAAELVLTALENARVEYDYYGNPMVERDAEVVAATKILRQALEAEQQAEQATWYHKHWGEGDDIFYLPTDAIPDGATPLYTRPQPQSAPWPTSLVDKVIKALSEYCETGEIGCADDLLAAICYEKDNLEMNLNCKSTQKRLATQWGFVPAQQPLTEELLEALQEIVAAADGEGWDQIDADFIKARAAIAKATGVRHEHPTTNRRAGAGGIGSRNKRIVGMQ